MGDLYWPLFVPRLLLYLKVWESMLSNLAIVVSNLVVRGHWPSYVRRSEALMREYIECEMNVSSNNCMALICRKDAASRGVCSRRGAANNLRVLAWRLRCPLSPSLTRVVVHGNLQERIRGFFSVCDYSSRFCIYMDKKKASLYIFKKKIKWKEAN